jgi:transcriptional regulator with XRE-family HTH domain
LPRHRRFDVKLGPFIAIGSRVVMLRHRLRWSRDELRRRAGVGHMTLARLERGEGCPRPLTLGRIAAAGGVAVDWLLGGGRPGEPLIVDGR